MVTPKQADQRSVLEELQAPLAFLGPGICEPKQPLFGIDLKSSKHKKLLTACVWSIEYGFNQVNVLTVCRDTETASHQTKGLSTTRHVFRARSAAKVCIENA
jgi:hypothetical protein